MKRASSSLYLTVSRLFVLMFASASLAQQPAMTNTLEGLKASFEKANENTLVAYGNNLAAVMETLKKNGNLDGYLVIEIEKKRFDAEKSVPLSAPKGVEDVWAAYQKQQLELLRKQATALDALVKQLTKDSKIDEAKDAKTEKDKIAFMLADAEARLLAGKRAQATNTVVTAKNPQSANIDATVKKLKSKKLVIVKAEYGPAGRTTDVTNKTRKLVRNNKLNIRGGADNFNEAFGDPAPGVGGKRFSLVYEYMGVTDTNDYPEYAAVTIPMPSE